MQLIALLPVLAFLGSVSAAPTLGKRTALKRCRARTTTTAAAPAATPSASASAPAGKVGSEYVVDTAQSSSPAASSAVEASPSASPAASSPTPAASSPSPAAASASPSPSSSAAPSTGGSTNNGANSGQLTPKGRKAGISSGNNLAAFGDKISWWYNWSPVESYAHSDVAEFVPMLWGEGGSEASERIAQFMSITGTPQYIIGQEEPDCAADGMSAGMSVDQTAAQWNSLMVPHGNAGSLLVSPSMCHQLAENGWLKEFQGKISRDFDIINLHINKDNIQGFKDVLDYYWNTYHKPMWVTEFACVNDVNGFVPCTDQGLINSLIPQIVDLFQNDDRVYAYAYSNGAGLGNVWPAWNQDGSLSQSGQVYLNSISKY